HAVVQRAEISWRIAGSSLERIDLSSQEIGEVGEAQRAADGEAVEAVELITVRPAAGLQTVLTHRHGPGIVVVEAVGDSAALVIDAGSEREGPGDRHLVDPGNGRGVGAVRPHVRQADLVRWCKR